MESHSFIATTSQLQNLKSIPGWAPDPPEPSQPSSWGSASPRSSQGLEASFASCSLYSEILASPMVSQAPCKSLRIEQWATQTWLSSCGDFCRTEHIFGVRFRFESNNFYLRTKQIVFFEKSVEYLQKACHQNSILYMVPARRTPLRRRQDQEHVWPRRGENTIEVKAMSGANRHDRSEKRNLPRSLGMMVALILFEDEEDMISGLVK